MTRIEELAFSLRRQVMILLPMLMVSMVIQFLFKTLITDSWPLVLIVGWVVNCFCYHKVERFWDSP
jgi:hypothetical protein